MRIEQLTFTRFIAAVAIVIFHFGKRVAPFDNDFISFLVRQSNVGVSYFYILSGFIMIISYGAKEKINTVDYYKNRFARIYPVYLLGLLIYLPIRILIYPPDFIIFFHATMLQSWFPGWVLNYNFPGWSVSVELFFYLLFPFLFNYLYSKKIDFKWLVLFIVIIWIISQVSFNYMLHTPYYKGENTNSFEFLFYFPLLHLNEFLIGNLAGLFYIQNYNTYQKNYNFLLIGIVILIVLALKYPIGLNYHNGLLGVLFIPFILFLSFNTGSLTRLFCRKPFIYLGEISYSLYIYQLPVFYYGKFLPITNETLLFFVRLLLLIFVSALSYRFIETPMREKIKKIPLPSWIK